MNKEDFFKYLIVWCSGILIGLLIVGLTSNTSEKLDLKISTNGIENDFYINNKDGNNNGNYTFISGDFHPNDTYSHEYLKKVTYNPKDNILSVEFIRSDAYEVQDE